MTIIGKAIVVENTNVKEVNKENSKVKEPTKAEIAAQLTELGIEFDEKATKAELVALIPQTKETEEE